MNKERLFRTEQISFAIRLVVLGTVQFSECEAATNGNIHRNGAWFNTVELRRKIHCTTSCFFRKLDPLPIFFMFNELMDRECRESLFSRDL